MHSRASSNHEETGTEVAVTTASLTNPSTSEAIPSEARQDLSAVPIGVSDRA